MRETLNQGLRADKNQENARTWRLFHKYVKYEPGKTQQQFIDVIVYVGPRYFGRIVSLRVQAEQSIINTVVC